jgi:hypothetical protein
MKLRGEKSQGVRRIALIRKQQASSGNSATTLEGTLGQVHAGGFLHDLIRVNADGASVAPSKLTNDERKKRISESWCRHLRKFPTSSENPVIQHRLIFSMSGELHDKLVASGINPDRVLHSTMKKAMAKFAERFHPNDAVGYAYGLHHDTDNLHVHVALWPALREAPMSDAAWHGLPHQATTIR